MSLKQMMNIAGVEHQIHFSPVTSNWVIELNQRQIEDKSIRPIRLGSKRVVLSSNQPQPPTPGFRLLGLILIGGAALAMVFLATQKPEAAKVTNRVQVCIPLAAGESLTANADNYIVRDWIIQVSRRTTMGNLTLLQFHATCSGSIESGRMLIAGNDKSIEIKKLTPTTR